MDSDGYVFITGRKKDLIIRWGVNISPMEITERLMEHPCVKEAVTIGISDKIYGGRWPLLSCRNKDATLRSKIF